MIGYQPNPALPATLLLSPCTGTLYDEGEHIPCGERCVSHFDANTDSREYYEKTGDSYCPYPNGLLSFAGFLPGSTDCTGILVPEALLGDVKVFANDSFFFDFESGEGVTIYVATRAIDDPDRHFAVAYRNAQDLWVFLEQLA